MGTNVAPNYASLGMAYFEDLQITGTAKGKMLERNYKKNSYGFPWRSTNNGDCYGHQGGNNLNQVGTNLCKHSYGIP